jgi:YVTN family beta-propeller protein
MSEALRLMYGTNGGGSASRARGFLVLGMLVMTLGLLAMPSAAMAFAYIANSGSNTISVVDISTTPPTVVATVPVGTNLSGLPCRRTENGPMWRTLTPTLSR